jgi:hypothetical protein
MLWHERAHSEPDHIWLRKLILKAARLEGDVTESASSAPPSE